MLKLDMSLTEQITFGTPPWSEACPDLGFLSPAAQVTF
jgi:hypothetical protein